MFLRKTPRKKDGKTHDYWSVVENKRVAGGRVVQRHVLYLGEINSSQAAVWRKAIEVLDDDAGHPRRLSLFPEDRCEGVAPDTSIAQLRRSDMQLCRPRQWGACWLAGQLWRKLELDRFWADRLRPSRKGTQRDQVLQVLVSYRLIAPGSEWKLHRDWFGKSAMADLLGADFGLAEAHKLYACHDLLLQHKADLFLHLMARWRDLFNANFDVLLYDLTSTYFEVNASDVAEGDKRRHGYSRDKRPDCPQVVIALVVTPDGLPLAYAMRRRQLKWLWKRLRELAAMEIPREEMLMKLGAARSRAPTAWRLVDIEMDKESSMFVYTLNRQKLRRIRRREGRYLLRTNLTENDPALLWQYYTQLVAVEEAFKNLKGDLAIRPVFHQEERRIEAHIFIAFLAYCLQITLQRRLHALAPGLTARSALEKFAAVQMIDVHLPTTDGRELLLTRYTQPEPELRLLIQQLKLQLPPQPPPRIATGSITRRLL